MKEANENRLHSFKIACAIAKSIDLQWIIESHITFRVDKDNGNCRPNQAAENLKQAWRVAESLTLNKALQVLSSLQDSRCL